MKRGSKRRNKKQIDNDIKTGLKVCSVCGLEKPISAFYKCRQKVDSHSSTCKKCEKKYMEIYYKLHKKECRNRELKRKYNITIDDYEKIFNNQGGCCAICGRHQSQFKRCLGIDHNHKTGFIRGELCAYCNHRLLGGLRDDKNRARGLISYLTKALQDDKDWR